MNKIKIGIIGGAGYTGGELLRILLHHPNAHISFIHSNSNAGNPVHLIHQDLIGGTDLVFTREIDPSIDLLFLCVGHGEARKFLEAHPLGNGVKVIDLSQDFRLPDHAHFQGLSFVYGLPEINRDLIRNARAIANPGCFATAIQLGLLPLAQAGLLDEVQTTGITGSTGAGQSHSLTSHFSWRANNIQAYKTLTHQHLQEIGATLHQVQPNRTTEVSFIPWRGDFTRGIFISSQMKSDLPLDEVNGLFQAFYENHPFTTICSEPIFLKQVVNTNKAVIQIEKAGNRIVIHSAIDNLLKGASGQAVQNMNLLFGIEEEAGLKLKANFF